MLENHSEKRHILNDCLSDSELSENYYQANDIGDGIWHIYEPGKVFSSLIIGQTSALLIDTGYGFGHLARFVRSLTDLPLTVVNTHGHFDHVGGNFQFDQVWMAPAERAIYEMHMREVRPITVKNFAAADEKIATRVPPGETAEARDATVSGAVRVPSNKTAEARGATVSGATRVLPPGFDRAAYLARPPKATLPLADRQIFDLGGRRVQAILMPGHTHSHMVFFDDRSHILFGGDNIANNVWLQFDFSAPLHVYRENLQSLHRELDERIRDERPPAVPSRSPAEIPALPASPLRILSSHSGQLFPETLLDCIDLAIRHIDDAKSRIFIHPRTGDRSLMHTEYLPENTLPGTRKIHIIYDRNNL